MKRTRTLPRLAGLACGLACTVLIGFAPTAAAQSLSASAFGDGGVSASAEFTLISSFQPSVSRPATTGEFDGYSLNLYPGFLAGVGEGRVGDVHRYVRAMERRLDHLPGTPGRDLEMMDRAHRHEND